MKGTATFESPLLSLTATASDGFLNDTLRYCRFVFCDDKPNVNKHGVEYEDFPTIAASAVGTPIKMRFLGSTIGNHVGSIPIGHITKMEEITASDGSHQLIANGVLFAEDYPEEIAFIENKFDKGEAPGVSWELGYTDKLVKDGVTWFKGLMTKAATFVRNPSYGSKTALLALASDNTISDEDFSKRLTEVANELRPKNPIKGGNIKVEEELKKAKEELATAIKERDDARAEVTNLTTAKASLETEKTDLQKEVDTQKVSIDAFTKKELIATRTTAVAEAGVKIEADDKKKDFWAGMTEEAFKEYVEDLTKAAKSAKGGTTFASRTASASAAGAPRINGEADETDLVGLRGRLGALSRTSYEVSE